MEDNFTFEDANYTTNETETAPFYNTTNNNDAVDGYMVSTFTLIAFILIIFFSKLSHIGWLRFVKDKPKQEDDIKQNTDNEPV
jgi:hypothetical protein